MNYINYKSLYLDFVEHSNLLSKQAKKDLIHRLKQEEKESISFKNLMTMNLIIKNDISQSNDKQIQRLKSYDKDYIQYILEYQNKYKLSNNQVSLEFKLSRNTISKWKKIY